MVSLLKIAIYTVQVGKFIADDLARLRYYLKFLPRPEVLLQALLYLALRPFLQIIEIFLRSPQTLTEISQTITFQ